MPCGVPSLSGPVAVVGRLPTTTQPPGRTDRAVVSPIPPGHGPAVEAWSIAANWVTCRRASPARWSSPCLARWRVVEVAHEDAALDEGARAVGHDDDPIGVDVTVGGHRRGPRDHVGELGEERRRVGLGSARGEAIPRVVPTRRHNDQSQTECVATSWAHGGVDDDQYGRARYRGMTAGLSLIGGYLLIGPDGPIARIRSRTKMFTMGAPGVAMETSEPGRAPRGGVRTEHTCRPVDRPSPMFVDLPMSRSVWADAPAYSEPRASTGTTVRPSRRCACRRPTGHRRARSVPGEPEGVGHLDHEMAVNGVAARREGRATSACGPRRSRSDRSVAGSGRLGAATRGARSTGRSPARSVATRSTSQQ